MSKTQEELETEAKRPVPVTLNQPQIYRGRLVKAGERLQLSQDEIALYAEAGLVGEVFEQALYVSPSGVRLGALGEARDEEQQFLVSREQLAALVPAIEAYLGSE